MEKSKKILTFEFIKKEIRILIENLGFLTSQVVRPFSICKDWTTLVLRGCASSGQLQESRSLGRSQHRKSAFTDFQSLCTCSDSRLTIWLAENTKRILCACSENWTKPEVASLGADQKGAQPLRGREWDWTWNFHEVFDKKLLHAEFSRTLKISVEIYQSGPGCAKAG